MSGAGDDTRAVIDAVGARSEAVVDALAALAPANLASPSALPGWTRLTIACHLRYGAVALSRMTQATMDGRVASYYPEGRAKQREATLQPHPGEAPGELIASLADGSRRLVGLWSAMPAGAWALEVREPDDNRDLGPLRLQVLPLLRLTELEVHGDDLAVGLPDWSEVFVRAALPFRLDWLNTRRTNHRAVKNRRQGSWLLVADEGLRWVVALDGGRVVSRPAGDGEAATAGIEGSARDLLALLLGRPTRAPLRHRGDVPFARAFSAAFPGP